jgi:hypothetical protein
MFSKWSKTVFISLFQATFARCFGTSAAYQEVWIFTLSTVQNCFGKTYYYLIYCFNEVVDPARVLME